MASFVGLRAASQRASRVAAATSLKKGTRCELLLRRDLRKLGLKFRTNVSSLPGCPDFVFAERRAVVFADGDFWHGRRLKSRLQKLTGGHNGHYWVEKITDNVARDRRNRRLLRTAGWAVLRLWESEINKNPEAAARRVDFWLKTFPTVRTGTAASSARVHR